MDGRPLFIPRKLPDTQRLAALGYCCPLCCDKFHADSKLREHAKTHHGENLGLVIGVHDENARKHFRREAIAKAYADTPC